MFDHHPASSIHNSIYDKQTLKSSIIAERKPSSHNRICLHETWRKRPTAVVLLIVLLLHVLIEPVAAGKKQQAPFESFNTTNPHKSSWCPNATCHNSPLCSPCNRRYLFLATTPRSGSTTLLHMMNLLPQIRLSGENWGEMFVSYQVEHNLHGDGEPDHDILKGQTDLNDGPFQHNGIPLQAMACPLQQILYTINPPPVEVQQRVHLPGQPSLEEYDKDTILGCKTIRMHQVDGADWYPYQAANYMKNAFPCSRVIVNIRKDIDQQFESTKKTGISGVNSTEQLKKNNEFLTKFADLLGSHTAKLIFTEEWTEDIAVLNSVVSWLGYQDCQFDKLVHDNKKGHKGRPHGYVLDHATHPKVGENCHYPDPTEN